MPADWDDGDVTAVSADLARARATGTGIRLELAARSRQADGSLRAEPVLSVELEPRTARQMLALLNRLVLDREATDS